MKKVTIFAFILLSVFTACKKSSYDAEKQLQKDEQLIKNFLEANNLKAQRDTTGIYYIISKPGSGNVRYTLSTNVRVKYTLRLLDGKVIPQTTDPITFNLGSVITGWRVGIPKIQPGGKIRLLVPSVWAYGPDDKGDIPANSVLDFDIELLDIVYN